MSYKNEALNIQGEILKLIENEDFDGIENLLEKRKEFYKEYAEHDSIDLKEFINSKEFKDSETKIRLGFALSKDKIKKELETLRASRNASKSYQNNTAKINGIFNKKI